MPTSLTACPHVLGGAQCLVAQRQSTAPLPYPPSGWYTQWGKRAVDITLSAIGLIVALPVMALTALALRWLHGRGGVWFRQERPGLGGRPFRLAKFKTMRDALGPDGLPLPDADRLTPFGSFLRRTSLDELPQLWNVLLGDLSLIGPRPLLKAYLPLYTPRQAARHRVRPGITGWAQVNGRNAVAWPERFEMDLYYVAHLSPGLDARILWMTLGRVVGGQGVSSGTSVTMEPYTGSPPGTP